MSRPSPSPARSAAASARGATAGLTIWTPAEDETLRASFGPEGLAAAALALPHRSHSAILHRAQVIGVSRRRRWTSQDDARLRRLWDAELDLPDIAARLSRTRSAVYWRAAGMGLPLGCPAGWRYLTVAARAAGFEVCTFRKVLLASGATIRRAVTVDQPRRGRVRSGHLRYIVAAQEVEPAVAAWLDTEPLGAAARRLGYDRGTLARRLRSLGIEEPAGARLHWRVRTEDLERATAIPLQQVPGVVVVPRLGSNRRRGRVEASLG